MATKVGTTGQGAIIEMAMALTDSPGFMEDARAIAAYQDGFEGNPDYIKAVIVFEGFRPNRSAEMHFGMAFGKAITLEIIQMGVTVAFHPKLFNLDQVFGHGISLPTGRLILRVALTWIKRYAGKP